MPTLSANAARRTAAKTRRRLQITYPTTIDALTRGAASAIRNARRFGIVSSAMSARPYRIGRSRTGLGLFATRAIKKRSRIAEYKGRALRTKEASKAERSGNRYLYEVNSRWTIDGSARSNIARYANHSCNPNTDTIAVKRRVFIIALRNIKPGEEITYDYGRDYLKNVIGLSNCKGGRGRRRRARRQRELRNLRKRRAARLARLRKGAR
jgi:uncharacterized protein